MQKTILLLSFLLWRITFAMAQQVDSLFTECVNCPLFLPDYAFSTAFIQVEGSNNNNLADSTQGLCGVKMKFEHEYLSDLLVTLKSPSGQTIDLIGPIGLFGETDSTIWDIQFVPYSEAAAPDPGYTPLWNSSQDWGLGNQYTGSYYPYSGDLASFNTGPVNGIWQVIFEDQQAIDIGLLHSFSLEFCDQSGQDSILLLPPDALGVLDTGTWTATLLDTSANATYIRVIWGDGTATSDLPAGSILQHEYADAGFYVIQLVAFNAIGTDTLNIEAHIVGALPSADVIVPSLWCNSAAQLLQLTNMDHVDEVSWSFLNSIPSSGTGTMFSMYYSAPVMDTGMVTITNSVGSVTYDIYINVYGIPEAQYDVQIVGGIYTFTNTSYLADSLTWFINGAVAGTGPVMVYSFPSGVTSANVKLVVTNPCGSDEFSQIFDISGTEDAALLANGIRIFPNPVTAGMVTIETTAKTSDEYRWTLVDASGKTHESGQFSAVSGRQLHTLTLDQYPAGVYWLQLQNSQVSFQKRLIIQQ